MAREIPPIRTERLYLRNIIADDALEIVRWRSDPDVYKYFNSPHAITVEEHLNWYSNRYLNDNNRYDWMAVDKDSNLVGVFGLRRENTSSETAEINYILAPECRGFGYAGEAIKALLDFARKDWNCKFAIAEIHEENKNSIRFASNMGMALFSKENQFLVYRKQLQENTQKTAVYFRVDGNSTIGIGHVMRCLSIADQIKECGADTIFITADEESCSIIRNKGFDYICLNSCWNDLDQETDELCKLIEEKEVKQLLVDSYFVTEKYLSKLKKHTRVIYIDDINTMKYPVNSLINYNIYGEDVGYDEHWYEHLYLGPKYAPLRTEFKGIPGRTFNGINSILITSGGTDEYNVIGNALDRLLKEFPNISYYCVLGKFNKNSEQLHNQYGQYKNIHMLSNVNNMSDFMRKCDVAITAGGSTCYELCACGLPSIIYTLADNQLGIAKKFSAENIIPWVGDVRNDFDGCLIKILEEVKKLNNQDLWEQRSLLMRKVVDGRGATRLAKVILSEIEDENSMEVSQIVNEVVDDAITSLSLNVRKNDTLIQECLIVFPNSATQAVLKSNKFYVTDEQTIRDSFEAVKRKLSENDVSGIWTYDTDGILIKMMDC